MSTHRFTAWDGTQDPLGPDVEEIFNRLSEDVFHGWDFETALRRMLSQGWRDRSGRRLMGLEEMTERLARQRRKQLEKYSLDGVFDDITEKLDNVVRMERQGIDERLAHGRGRVGASASSSASPPSGASSSTTCRATPAAPSASSRATSSWTSAPRRPSSASSRRSRRASSTRTSRR